MPNRDDGKPSKQKPRTELLAAMAKETEESDKIVKSYTDDVKSFYLQRLLQKMTGTTKKRA